jgi:hypothetical protein
MSETAEQPQVQQQAPQAIPEQLNQQQALSVLIQAVNYAYNKGGVYSMQDTALILKALNVFTPPQPAADAAPAPAPADQPAA